MNYRTAGLLLVVAGVALVLSIKYTSIGLKQQAELANVPQVETGADLPTLDADHTLPHPDKPELPTGSDLPNLVLFGSGTCSQCRLMGHVMGTLLPELKTIVDPLKVDPDEAPELAKEFKIRAIPTLVLLSPDGAERDRHIGALSESDFKAFLANGGVEWPSEPATTETTPATE